MDGPTRAEPPLVVTKPFAPTARTAPVKADAESVVTGHGAPAGPMTAAALWSRFIEIAATKPSVMAAAEPLVLERLEGGEARLVARDASALASAKPVRLSIEEVMSKAAGRTVRVELALAAEAEPAARVQPMVDTAARAEAERHPLVRRAAEVLGARLVDVQDDVDDQAAR